MQPTKLDDLVSQRVVAAVRAGASRVAAAEAARISRATLYRWLKDGAAGVEPYARFTARVREAEGELESELVAIIKGHAVDSWQCAAFLLERKWPRRWALRREREAKLPAVSEAEAEALVAKAAGLHASKPEAP